MALAQTDTLYLANKAKLPVIITSIKAGNITYKENGTEKTKPMQAFVAYYWAKEAHTLQKLKAAKPFARSKFRSNQLVQPWAQADAHPLNLSGRRWRNPLADADLTQEQNTSFVMKRRVPFEGNFEKKDFLLKRFGVRGSYDPADYDGHHIIPVLLDGLFNGF